MRLSTRTFFWLLFAGAWCVAIGSGLRGLAVYATTPGDPGLGADRWPSDSEIPFDARRPNLILFVHPRCPCSSASLTELERILAATGSRAATHVLVFRPTQAATDWEQTGLWDRAR